MKPPGWASFYSQGRTTCRYPVKEKNLNRPTQLSKATKQLLKNKTFTHLFLFFCSLFFLSLRRCVSPTTLRNFFLGGEGPLFEKKNLNPQRAVKTRPFFRISLFLSYPIHRATNERTSADIEAFYSAKSRHFFY